MKDRKNQGQGNPPFFSREDLLRARRDPNLRFADRDWVLKLNANLWANPQDPLLHELHALVVHQQARRHSLNEADSFYANHPPLPMPLATEIACVRLPDGRVFGPSLDAILRNVGVPGPTGWGKSSMLRVVLLQASMHANVIAVDRKRELRALSGLDARWKVLSWKQLKLALLEPPPGVSRDIWFTEVISFIARSTSLYASQRPMGDLLFRAFLKLRDDINLDAWIAELKAWDPGRRNYRSYEYRDAFLAVLCSLRQNAPIFGYARSNCLTRLFSDNPGGTVVEIDTLPVEHYAFLVGYLQRWAYLSRLYAGAPPTPTIFALDDATLALEGQRDKNSPGGISPLAEAMFMGRSLGVGTIWCAHNYGSLAEQVRTNTETLIVVGASGSDLPHYQRVMGLSGAQTARLRMLDRGEACVHSPGTWALPVLGRFPYVTANVDVQLIEERAAEFLQQVVAEVGGKKEEPEIQDSFDPVALRLAVSAGFKPYLILTTHYEQLKLSRDDGRRALEFLEAHGLGRAHRLSSGARGGQLSLLEITDSGWTELANRAFARPAKVCKGGFPHEPVALALHLLGHSAGHAVYFERAFGGVYCDVCHETRDGRLIAYQIGMSSPSWEVHSLRRLLHFQGITELHLVCRDKAFMGKVSASLQSKLDSDEEARVHLCTAGEVLLRVQV